MNQTDDKKNKLRDMAESLISSDNAETAELSNERMREIIHELRVHQIELELQNDEMQKTYNELLSIRDSFARLFNNSPVGYLMLDSYGLVKMSNETFLQMAGRSENSINGKSFAELLPSPDREIFIGRWKAFYKNPADKTIVVRMSRPSGDYLHVNLKGRLEQEGLIINPGMHHSSGLLLIVSDISLQKKADDDAIRTEKKFRILAENIDETFWLKDRASGRIEYVTPAYESMFGNTCESLYNDPMSFLKNIHPDDLDSVIKMQRELIDEKKMFNNEYRIVLPDGNVRWISARTYPVLSPDGDVVKFAGIAEDITEKKIQDENIKRLLQEKEILLREVHHRVKNNMNIISSLLYFQAMNSPEKRVSAELLEAQRRIISMSVLYDRLYRSINFSDISADEYFKYFFSELDQTLSHDGRIVIRTDIDKAVLDSGKMISIGIIVNELVTNSLKYAFPDDIKGNIFISLKNTESGMLKLVVRDDGIGMPENFDVKKSTGFGLNMVNMLVEQIEGDIDFQLDNGTVFMINFSGVK